MMKKICLLVLIMVLGKLSFSQGYPVTQYIGTDSAVVISRGAMQSRLVNYVYTDTTQANTQRIKSYPGAQIVTTNGGTNFILWIRNQTATRWLQIPAGSGVGNIYTVDGTLTGNRTLLGANNSLTFNQISSLLFGADTTTVTNDGVATLNVKGAIGRVLVVDTTAPADERIYELKSSNGEFFISKINDAQTLQDSTFYISSGGNIGINTFSPGARLGVNGNTFVKGQLFAGDTALSTYQVEGILTTPYVLGRKAVDTTLSTQARPTGVQGHVVGRGPIANRLQGGTFYATTDSASTANSTGSLRATTSWTAHNGSGTLANAWGSYNIVSNKTTGTITNAYGSVSGVENRGATSTINKLQGSTTEVWNNYGGTIDTAWGQVISIYNNNASSNIGAVYGLSIGRGLITPTGGTHFWRNAGTIGSSYGIYLDSAIDVGTNRFALYSNSYSDSYLKGNLGLGTTTPGGRLAIVDTGGFALKINYNSASTVADSNAAIYAENNGLSSYVAILNEKTTNNTGGQYPLLVQSSLLSGTAQAGMATGIHFATPDAQGNKKVTQLAFRTTTADSATYTNRAELRLWNNGSLSTPYYLLGNGNMGLGTSTPDSNLTVVNGALFQRGVRMSGLPTGTGTKGLRVDANGTLSVADTLSNGVSGSGTTNYISKFTGSSTIGNSTMQDDGTNVGIGITPSASIFNQLQVQYAVLMGNSSDATANYLGSNFYLGAGAQWKYIASNQASQFAQTSGGFNWNTAPVGTAGNNLTWTTRMQLTNGGLLGVGTSFIDSNLTVGLGTHLKRGVRMSALPTGVGTKALRIDANGTLSVADTLTNGVSGSLVSGYITKATGTNSIDTSQIYQNNGNIGIGTISPASGFKVDMVGSLRVGNGSSYNNVTINGNGGAGSYLRFQKNGTNKGDIGPYSAVLGGVPPYSGSNDDLTYSSVGGHFFNTNAGIKMYLNNAGNLGLSASPDSMLTVLEGAYLQRGVRMSGLPTAAGTKALRIDANGTLSVADTLTNGVSGSLTANFIPKATGTTTLNNSPLSVGSSVVGLGLGVVPPNSWSNYWALQLANGVSLASYNYADIPIGWLGTNAYHDGIGDIRASNGAANKYLQDRGNHKWYVAGAGVSGSYISWTQAMTLDTLNRLGVGTTTLDSMFKVAQGVHLERGVRMSGLPTGTGTKSLRVDANGTLSIADTLANGISGTGTTNYIPKFTSSSAIGNSVIQENVNSILIGANTSSYGTLNLQRFSSTPYATLTLTDQADPSNEVGIYLRTNGNPAGISSAGAPIAFYTGGPGISERMRLDASGNLGLGTSSPSSYSNLTTLTINGTNGSVIDLKTGNTLYGELYSLANEFRIDAVGASSVLKFLTNSVTRMTLDASGNLGLGTTSPAVKLDVVSSGATGSTISSYDATATKVYNQIGGTSGNQYLQLGVTASSTFFNDYFGTAMVFKMADTERMRITSGGNVGIGTTSPDSALTVQTGAWVKRGLRLSGLPTGVGTKELRIDANGVVYANDTLSNDISGSGTTNYIPKFTGTSAIGNSNLYEGTYGIGLGTLGPQSSINNLATTIQVYQNSANGSSLKLSSALANTELYQADGAFYIWNYGGSGAPILFGTNNAERMRLDASGNLGIGTSSPGAKLEISTGGLSNGGLRLRQGSYNYWDITSAYATTNADLIFYMTGSEKMRLDASGNLGLGVTPSAHAGGGSFQLGSGKNISFSGQEGYLAANQFYNGSSSVYISNGYATQYAQESGIHKWLTAPSGTAGNAISFTQAMTLDASGNLGIGSTTPSTSLNGAKGLVINSGAISDAQFRLQNNNTGSAFSDGALLSLASDNSMYLYNYENAAINFGTNNAIRAVITSGGDVGIGTTSPAANLDIQGAGAANLNFKNTTGGTDLKNVRLRNLGNVFYIEGINDAYSAITNQFTFDIQNNRLGIGTTSPNANVDIIGSSNDATSFGSFIVRNSSDVGMSFGGFSTTYAWIQGNRYGVGVIPIALQANGGNVGIGTTSPNGKLDISVGNQTSLGLYSIGQSITSSGGSNGNLYQIAFGYGTGAFYGHSAIAGLTESSTGYNSGALVFATRSATTDVAPTERMRITSGGLVGIGTSSPSQLLQVAGNEINATKINAVGTVYGSGAFLNAFSSAGGNDVGFAGFIASQNNNTTNRLWMGVHSPSGANQAFFGTPDSTPLAFWTNSTERMRITSGGAVGIGTNSPTYKLSVTSSTNGDGIYYTEGVVGTWLGSLNSVATVGAVTNHPLAFYNNGTERMRINTSGELLINTTSDAGDYKLQVNGSARINPNNSSVLAIGRYSGAYPNAYISGIAGSGESSGIIFETQNAGTSTTALTLTSTQNAEFAGSIKTAAPSGGTAKPWRLGQAATVTPTSPNRTIEVEIDGVTYYIHAKTTND